MLNKARLIVAAILDETLPEEVTLFELAVGLPLVRETVWDGWLKLVTRLYLPVICKIAL